MKTDAQIQKDVMDELNWEPRLKASEIGVSVDDGIVCLAGFVENYSQKLNAEKSIQKITGVRGLVNNINVKLTHDGQKNDLEIAEAVANAMKWNTTIPDQEIKVKVENGWVTLNGEVEWDFQRQAAHKESAKLLGVRGVINNISLKPRATVNDVKSKILKSFERNAVLDAKGIKVDVNGSKITISGTVHSWEERSDAEIAAWSAPGVTDVNNKIEVRELASVFGDFDEV
jgi:osmotically-inducible protein OsmY